MDNNQQKRIKTKFLILVSTPFVVVAITILWALTDSLLMNLVVYILGLSAVITLLLYPLLLAGIVRDLKGLNRRKSTAVILAIFFGMFSWLYTYEKNSKKFWINLVASLVSAGLWSLASWLWAIIDNSKKPESYFTDYNAPPNDNDSGSSGTTAASTTDYSPPQKNYNNPSQASYAAAPANPSNYPAQGQVAASVDTTPEQSNYPAQSQVPVPSGDYTAPSSPDNIAEQAPSAYDTPSDETKDDYNQNQNPLQPAQSAPQNQQSPSQPLQSPPQPVQSPLQPPQTPQNTPLTPPQNPQTPPNP